ncbi:large ribosomal subunit protein bL36m [Loxodonta africana]|uniref:large ribosomal subunit protein bL36m n=1 Tax=Loxodonta africana TaxID=9785 RepID=UPI0005405471|nr:39S ribosomal protein L36, mitochondrial [Loxodonta africana]
MLVDRRAGGVPGMGSRERVQGPREGEGGPQKRTLLAAASSPSLRRRGQARRRAARARYRRGWRLVFRFSHNMATHLIRTVVVSVMHPFLHRSGCTVKSRGLSTFLLGSLCSALPVGTSLLKPSLVIESLLSNHLMPRLQPALGLKTKVAIRRRCKDCYQVKRRGRWFIYCKTNPKHKQRQS